MKSTAPCHHRCVKTPYGCFTAYFSRAGLARLDFPDESTDSASAHSLSIGPKMEPALKEQWSNLTASALMAGLEGKPIDESPPLDLSGGTELQRIIWAFLQRIPPGDRMSYSEVAKGIGHPRAARAVGRACGANPIPILVPCHRVVAADGGLGGYSGGLHWKRWLLDRER